MLFYTNFKYKFIFLPYIANSILLKCKFIFNLIFKLYLLNIFILIFKMEKLYIAIFVILIIIIIYLITNNNNNYKIKSYIDTITTDALLPIMLIDDLYWLDLYLQDPYDNSGSSYRMALDSGSDLITIPAASCNNCQGPYWPTSANSPSRSTSYQGGQDINYQLVSAYCPNLQQTLQVAVMVNGSSNTDGPAINLLGLLNSTLHLTYLQLNFVSNYVRFLSTTTDTIGNVNISSLTFSTLRRIPYLALPINSNSVVQWTILDTGSNYCLIDPSYPLHNGFSFTVGSTTVTVDASLIRPSPALVPNSIILGNRIMRNYNWLFDLANLKVTILA